MRVTGVAVKVGDTLEPIPIIVAVPSQVETDNHDHYFTHHVEYVSGNRRAEIKGQISLFIAYWVNRAIKNSSYNQYKNLSSNRCNCYGQNYHCRSIVLEEYEVQLITSILNLEFATIVMSARVSPSWQICET